MSKRMAKLILFMIDGKLEIDNNLVKNAIRPVDFGRKNYLFACSHWAAQKVAMSYSILCIYKIINLHPYEWLTDVLNCISTYPCQQTRRISST